MNKFLKYCADNGVDPNKPPQCVCGNPVGINKAYPGKGWNTYCSDSCSKKYRNIKPFYAKLEDYDWLYHQRIILRKSKDTIAKELGCSTSLINKYLSKHNISEFHLYNQIKHKSITISKEILEELYVNKHWSANKIAQHYGSYCSSVLKALKQYGILKRNISESVSLVVSDIASTKQKKYGYAHFPDNIAYSQTEREIVNYLNELGFNFQSTKNVLRDNKELDGYEPSKGIAIEYCGLYWHSEQFKDRKYHYNKFKECEDKGIKLLTIFEDEWLQREQQVKQFLQAQLGIFQQRIFARKCQIKLDIDYKFFADNHIQGAPRRITYMVSLLYEGERIAAISFAPHHRTNNTMVLNRLAFKSGVQVIGGFAKLLKLVDFDFITWSDNRWSNGNIYKMNGFKLDAELNPDYSYVKGQKRLPKQTFKDVKNERTNVKLYRIYDCGKRRWIRKMGA